MKPSTLFTATVILMLSSCNQKSEPLEGKKIENIKIIDSASSNEIAIIGDWLMNETFDNGIITTCNQCPSILFRPDHTATISTTGGYSENMFWHLNKNRLRIDYIINTIKDKTFPDTAYYIIITKDKNMSHLQIKETSLKYSYMLTKQN